MKGVFGDCQFTCFPDCQLALPPESAKNLSYGLNAHAIGTARALEEGDECGAFAALGMSLLGILIALLLPFALG